MGVASVAFRVFRDCRPVAPPDSILSVSGLRVERGGTVILHDLDWTVEAGQHWAILGPNGSGKTSLLSALTGYLMPTAGRVFLLGQVYGESDWRELRKQVGLVSSSLRQRMPEDEPALVTVAGGKHAMIDFRGRLSPAERQEAQRLLRKVGCAHAADRPWRVLSQGERQRVLIARALMAHPRVLILDEPCAGLDPAAREHFLRMIQGLGQRRTSPTLILVTHHVEEIVPVFSHVLLLRSGTVLAAGPKPATLTSPNLTLAFRTPMKVARKQGRYSLRVGENEVIR